MGDKQPPKNPPSGDGTSPPTPAPAVSEPALPKRIPQAKDTIKKSLDGDKKPQRPLQK